ncbi:MAG TPA: sigma-70 family RNA polymerase sigma factor, partial [Acidobacteriota bacterium]|nr:sigma-70 family RNA polymerase sigma factor [Acidobacteriota bacterium]
MATYAPDFNALETKLHGHLRSSDDASFQKLFVHFRQRIYRTALRILKEEESAKDAVQETMINVHRAADSFRGDSRLSTWINRITVNVCLEMLRRN